VNAQIRPDIEVNESRPDNNTRVDGAVQDLIGYLAAPRRASHLGDR
jgi:hypothetical protein